GQVRRGRGQHQGPRPGHPDSRRGRPDQRVRAGGHARCRAHRADRAGEPGDDPQLRRPAFAGSAEVLLSRGIMTETTDAPFVRYEVADGFATLTFDSPHNRNALSSKLVRELVAGIDAAVTDPAVRGIVLTHTGNTFCAGADLSEAANSDPATAADQRTRQMIDVLRGLVAAPKPVIAQIDGNVRA